MTQNTTQIYLKHVKYLLITTEKKVKEVNWVSLKMNDTGMGNYWDERMVMTIPQQRLYVVSLKTLTKIKH